MNNLLLTGASGFLGRNILPSIQIRYEVVKLGRSANSEINCDLGRVVPVLKSRFETVVHAAGLAHVRHEHSGNEAEFFQVNLEGTKNLCRALESSVLPGNVIYISSVSVYGREDGEFIDESHPLNGISAYARSKIAAEAFLLDWCGKTGVPLTILRPALLIGEDPKGNLGDMLNAIERGYYFTVGGGNARRSVAMADDIGRLIPFLKNESGVFNFCDDMAVSLSELGAALAAFGNHRPLRNVPYWLASLGASVGDFFQGKFPIDRRRLSKLTKSLTFSNTSLRTKLGFSPRDVLVELANIRSTLR